jgi:spermidine/putrescine transport system substrate-binding protein
VGRQLREAAARQHQSSSRSAGAQRVEKIGEAPMSRIITSRRRLLQTAGATGGLLAAPALIRPRRALAAGVVNVWTYDGFVPEGFKEQFEAETGIEVRLRLVDDQGKEFNLMAAEAPELSADIVTVAGHRFRQFIDSELIEPVAEDQLANWANINPVYTDSDWIVINDAKWGVPILMGSEGLSYNTDYVSAEEASSWAIMFDEKYKGKTAYIVQDFMSITLLYLGYDGNMIAYIDDREKAAAAVNHTRDFMIEHKDMVRKYYDSGAEIQQMFINEDIVLGQSWSGPAAKLIMDGFPLRYTIPKEGSFAFVYTLNVAKNAKNRDNAYTFLNALLAEPGIGTAMTQSTGFVSTLTGAEKGLSDLERAASSLPQEELERLVFFRADANEMKYDLIDRAVEEVKAA